MMADDRRQQLADEVVASLPHEDWCHWDLDCCGCTCEDTRAAIARNLLPLLDRVAADAAAEALEEFAKSLNTSEAQIEIALMGAHFVQQELRARAAELRAPARTDEEN